MTAFPQSFYRAAAACSFLSALTTLGLIFLPELYGPAQSLEHRLELTNHPAATLRAWVYLAHPFLVMMAALGVAAALRRSNPGTAAVGFLGFLLWGFTEAAQQTLTLATFRRWADAFPAADPAAQELIRAQVATYDAVWDAMYWLLLIGFLAGNLIYSLALLKRTGFDRVIGACFLAAALLTAFILSREFGGPGLPASIDPWVYPAIQPLARILIGVWLWRARDA